MKKILSLTLFCCLLTGGNLAAQLGYSANELVLPYEGGFRPGSNIGQYPIWDEIELANLAAGNAELQVAGVGVKALRPGLFEDYVENFGYETELPAFQHFESLDLLDNTCIVGFPSPQHQDPTFYCSEHQSQLFANMYADIWDDGTDGTPINEENYYANYIYRLVTLYKDYIKFWEIWNEPGFDYTKAKGWLPPGAPGNWWENNPTPCDYKLRAPIFNYIRLLRISYEVIKTVDPEAYVVVSGVGFPSFLDAILRNSDNPVDGTSSDAYPLTGGAYFDVIGFHSYPHFDGSLRYYDEDLQDFVNTRHSDAAADGIIRTKAIYQEVLDNYGYDGNTFPEKLWTITEANLPRKAFDDFIGSEVAQRNYLIKAQVECVKSEITQFHVFKLAEDQTYEGAGYEFDLMGFYQKLDYNDLYFNEVNEEGIAYKTTTDLIFNKTYDPARTAAMNLPTGVKGAAFLDAQNNYTYVLWAATTTDNSEVANAVYSFPTSWNITTLQKKNWDYGKTYATDYIPANDINLTGTPIFLTEPIFQVQNNSTCLPGNFNFSVPMIPNAASYGWSFVGATPASATESSVDVIYNQAGNFEASLKVFDAVGNILVEQKEMVHVGELATPNFSSYTSGPLVVFNNQSSNNVESFEWDFGDNTTSNLANPTHVYFFSGNYTVTLTVTNACGTVTKQQNFTIQAPSTAPLPYTAKDQIVPYTKGFRPGVNLKFYAPWTDDQLGDIAAGNLALNVPGAGVKSLRTLLPESFFSFWGYDIRVNTFEHYNNLDLRENTARVGFPSPAKRDPYSYCPDEQSTLFANLYLDIWDDGSDGTPVNDSNHYALYLYNTVNAYKDYIRFWEIWNSPDYDETGETGWLPPGQPGNWWENNPDPCDYELAAPIFHYVRMLRISYEIIKQLDPEAYVTIPGLGFPSFLDAVMRNTDNPENGSISPGYPHRGGAYFDAVGINAFPHFDGSISYFDADQGGFVYERHSDAAVDGLFTTQQKYQMVAESYQYDGTTYPAKLWLFSETNLPRKAFGDFIGSQEAQRNFTIKAYIKSIRHNIAQLHLRNIGEETSFEAATNEFDLMGLYKKLEGTAPYGQVLTHQGIAYQATTKILFGSEFDPIRTLALDLPETVEGAAFKDGNGNYTYVLWARTIVDQSESVSVSYSFPDNLNLTSLYERLWNFGQTGNVNIVSSANLNLGGTPVFLSETNTLISPPIANLETIDSEACPNAEIQFSSAATPNTTSWNWTFPGGIPASSTEENPSVLYLASGNYQVALTASNAAGSHTVIKSNYIFIDAIPTANFNFSVDGSTVVFTNQSSNATAYQWLFDDNTSTGAWNPTHSFFENGTYEVKLVAINACGADTSQQTVMINAAPMANFANFIQGDCAPFLIHFVDQSSANPIAWEWNFPGGNPATSNEKDPSVTFANFGVYSVQLIVDNGIGLDTLTKTIDLGNPTNVINETLCVGEALTVNGTLYDESMPTGTETIVGGSVAGCDSIIQVDLHFVAAIINDVNGLLCDGESLMINNVVYDASNPSGVDTLLGAAYGGCDSIIQVALSFTPNIITSLTDTINLGETYLVGNSTYTNSGIYSDTLLSSQNCDSIINLNLTVTAPTSIGLLSPGVSAFSCFPNPFINELTFEFELPKATSLSLQLYDLNGKMILQLFEATDFAAGRHTVQWEILPLTSGVYVVRLETPTTQLIQKMIKL
ncbi:MAG: PKD domain-containing protein [Saprospiraceae bacterium]